MEIYKEFAYLYTKGPYPTYSKRMAELLPNIFGKLGVKPERILDLACGERRSRWKWRKEALK